MGIIDKGWQCEDVREFVTLLMAWEEATVAERIAPEGAYKGRFMRVPVGGVDCSLSGDTTRQGVGEFLRIFRAEPVLTAVANKNGVVNRIAVGASKQVVTGFYLYADEALPEEQVLLGADEPADAPVSSEEAADVARDHEVVAPGVDVTGMAVGDLLSLHAAVMAQLKDLDVLKTGNNPCGDYAEWLVAHALHGDLADPSQKSFDLTADDYGTVQVKARLVSTKPKPGELQSGVFHDDGFAWAAFVLLDKQDYSVRRACLVPRAAVAELWKWRPHVNGFSVFMRPALMDHPDAVDITELLRQAARGR